MVETVIERLAPAMERLRSAVATETAAQIAKAQAILDLALAGDWLEGDEFELVGQRPVRIGGDGTPLVDESLPLEIAALLGISVTGATFLIRDVVNLHSRFPSIWTGMSDGRVPLWRARQLTQLADTFDLGYAECLRVDGLVEPCLGRLGWGRVLARFRAAVIQVAPAKVTAHADRSRRSRYVHTGVSQEDPSLAWMSALADTADVKAFEHLLGLVTKALVEAGDPDPIDVVRSRALGRMADPEGVLALLDGVDDSTPAAQRAEKPSRRRHAPTAQVFVHVGSDLLEDGGPARVEKIGPILVDELSHLVGHHRIRLTPVVYVNGAPEPAVDAYHIPEPIRESVLARDRFKVFPYSSREARGCDLDHTVAYVGGTPGQTRPSNLGPLTRRAHRGKTHAGWTLDQPRPGVFRWTSPRGQTYRVGPDGTTNLTAGSG
ncbi:hypothetical protein [Propionicimonas sp.]|uniref:hypothetical protein n=1 Tax=Propionicimonas sp. TaxID=1955623 RepID=UPI0039E50D04